MRSLEEYIIDMEKRSTTSSSAAADRQSFAAHAQSSFDQMLNHQSPTHSEDVWTQLRHKENDLQLAAELGKALLEKNEEMQRQHDHELAEYSHKLEEVEQDRHVLRRTFATRESEYETRIAELEKDVAELTSKSTCKEAIIRQWEKEKTSLLNELSAQNARLTQQLKESQRAESQLQRQIVELQTQCAMGKSNLQEHVSSVLGLRDELELMAQKRSEMKRRLSLAALERDNLTSALEEASARILLMERHARDQDMRLQEFNVCQQQDALAVEERLHNDEQRSLLVEMDISEPTLSQECMSVYRQLRGLVQQLKTHADDDSGLHSDCSTATDEDKQQQHHQQRDFSAGLLSEVAQELVGLVLDSDIVRMLERLEQARFEIQERDQELARRADHIIALQTKVSVADAELQAALEERDRARHDASHSSLNQDEAVCKAREVRDQAVSRKNKAEVELAKIRVELLQANSQLIEAIQQKVELSQQLEQWQMDMQELLDEQVKSKLTSQEIKMRPPETGTTQQPIAATTTRRLLQLFQR